MEMGGDVEAKQSNIRKSWQLEKVQMIKFFYSALVVPLPVLLLPEMAGQALGA